MSSTEMTLREETITVEDTQIGDKVEGASKSTVIEARRNGEQYGKHFAGLIPRCCKSCNISDKQTLQIPE
jgi:hypothetical protein